MNRLDRQTLCELIPHAGRMCLLDSVVDWDEVSIRCQSHTHRSADHPLRSADQLHAVHCIEYGAQAMAVHGGLLARRRGEGVPMGFLAAIRNVALYVDRLDNLDTTLDVTARQLMAEQGSLIYEFEVDADGRRLAEGRTTVIQQGEMA